MNDAETTGSRERLLEVAEAAFAELGYDGASVQSIAEQAGLGKPMVYYYFGSKAGLYEDLLRHRLRQSKEAVQTALKPLSAKGATETREAVRLTIRHLLTSLLDHGFSRPAFLQIMRRELAAGFPTTKDNIESLTPTSSLAEFFTRAQEEHTIRADIPASTIAMAVVQLQHYVIAFAPFLSETTGWNVSDRDDRSRLLDVSLDIVFSGLWQEHT